MRIMELDYGSKTVGVAVSDPLGLTAQGIETICRKEENKLRKTLARIEELVKEYEVEKIVLGLPKHMNNDLRRTCGEVIGISRDAHAPHRFGSGDVGRASLYSFCRAYTDRKSGKKRRP